MGTEPGGGENGLEDPGAPFNIQRDTTRQAAYKCGPGDGKTHPNANANALLSADEWAVLGGAVSSQRHNGGANYIFCDGHAKWSRATAVIGQCSFAATLETGNNGINPDFRLQRSRG